MTNIYPNLAKKMADHNVDITTIAELLSISVNGVYRRLRGYTEFKFIEIIKLCKFFKEPNAVVLFVRFDNNRQTENCQENITNEVTV